jgi:hypothetical protein
MKKMVAVILIILPYALMKGEWSDGGEAWLYWASGTYASLASLIIGVACFIFPNSVAKWVRNIPGNSVTMLPEHVLTQYRFNGMIVLVFFFLNTFLVIAAYVKCPSVICT